MYSLMSIKISYERIKAKIYSLFLFSETIATSIIMCNHRMNFINFADFIIIISRGVIQMNHL